MNNEICRYIIFKLKNKKILRFSLDCLESDQIDQDQMNEEVIFINNYTITENQYYEDAFNDILKYKKIKLPDIQYAIVKYVIAE
jgi:hypothetical protein